MSYKLFPLILAGITVLVAIQIGISLFEAIETVILTSTTSTFPPAP